MNKKRGRAEGIEGFSKDRAMVYSKRLAGVSLVACLSLVTGFVAPQSQVSVSKEDWRKTNDVIVGMSPASSKPTPTALRASAVSANGDLDGAGGSAPYNYGPGELVSRAPEVSHG